MNDSMQIHFASIMLLRRAWASSAVRSAAARSLRPAGFGRGRVEAKAFPSSVFTTRPGCALPRSSSRSLFREQCAPASASVSASVSASSWRGLSDQPRRDVDDHREPWQRQKDEEEAERAREEARPKGVLARGLGATVTAGVLLSGKLKWVLGALKFTKMLPAASMLASTGAYAIFYGWPFAAGMVGLIAVHEAGHLAVMRAYGIPAGPMVFLPFMGAFVEMKERPKDVKEEAMVAFGGPVVGGAAAVAMSAAGVALESDMLVALADFGIMINLFNLLPIGQLDGGRIGGAVSPLFLVGGLAAGGAIIFNGLISNPIFYLVMLGGGFTTYERVFGGGTHDSYYRIPWHQRAAISSAYFALVAALLAAMAWNAGHRKSLRQLRSEAGGDAAAAQSSTGAYLEKFADDWADDDDAAQQEAIAMQRELDDFHQKYFGDVDDGDNNA